MAYLAFLNAGPPEIEDEVEDLVLCSLGQAYDEQVEMSLPSVLLEGTTAIVIQVSGCLEAPRKA